MKVTSRWRAALKWGLAPLAIATLAAGLGRWHANQQVDAFAKAVASLPRPERDALKGAPEQAITNAAWAFGDAESVKRTLKAELDRLPEAEGELRARALLRFGIIDTNPEGQAAVFSAACAAAPRVCDDMKAAAERELKARFVEPGNRLPLFISGDHPAVP